MQLKQRKGLPMKLELNDISKMYGAFYALKDISVTLENGVYGILGANGAGKTTLINILIGVIQENSGFILLDGKNIKKMGTDYLDKIGYLPQYPQFYPNFKMREFLDYMCCIKGISKKQRRERIDFAIEQVNLQEHEKKRIRELSGGMRQRLGIAQAILNNPEILVLDEPTAGLDPGERIRFRNIISRLSKDRMVMVATHIVSDIEYIANEVLILQNGCLVQKGTIEELCAEVEGKVWQLSLEEKDISGFVNRFLVANMKREGNKISMRIISDDKPDEMAVYIKPQLEDVFLLVFGR